MATNIGPYTLLEDGFVILSLTVPCAFADSSAFWNYLNTLPELDFAAAGVQSLQETKPSHFGNDPRGILPFASTFHHTWNRDLRAIAYIHALPSIYEYFEQTSDPSMLPRLYVEQMFDGFSVRGPGRQIPRKSARSSKLAIPYSFLRESDAFMEEQRQRGFIGGENISTKISRAKQQMMTFAGEMYDQAVENTRQLWADVFGKQVMNDEDDEDQDTITYLEEDEESPSTVHFGDDQLDFETCDKEKEIAKKFHRQFPNQWLFHGWMNLSFPANADSSSSNPELLQQFMTYIPKSHLSHPTSSSSSRKEENVHDDHENSSPPPKVQEERVSIPPNSIILIHPLLKTSMTKGTIHRHSYSVRQYISFRVVESTSSSRSPKSLFSDQTRELTLSQQRVPFMASGHRPCVFRFDDLDDHRHSDQRVREFKEFNAVLSRPFRKIYHYVANNNLYARLEERLTEDGSNEDDNLRFIHEMIEDEKGPMVFPPKVMVHLHQQQQNEESIENAIFSSYTPLDLEMVWSIRSLQDDLESIDNEILTKEVERLVMSRDGKGFAEWSQQGVLLQTSSQKSDTDEDDEEEEEGDDEKEGDVVGGGGEEEDEAELLLTNYQDGGTKKTKKSGVSLPSPNWNYKNLVWKNRPEMVPLFRREQDILALKRMHDLNLTDTITRNTIISLDRNKNSYWQKQSVRYIDTPDLRLFVSNSGLPAGTTTTSAAISATVAAAAPSTASAVSGTSTPAPAASSRSSFFFWR